MEGQATKSDDKKNIWLSCRLHAVELGFGITVHKIQRQKRDNIILDLNPRPFKS